MRTDWQWLDAIKDHIAKGLYIEADQLDDAPFSQWGGLGKAYEVFGNKLEEILNELNTSLAV